MGSTTAAGTALAITAAKPATRDAAGYGALTFTEIGGIEKIGTIGASFAKVEFQPLKGPKVKHKGSVDYGSLAPTLAHDDADAGQNLLRASAASNAEYTFMVTLPDGAIRYFEGRTFGYPEAIEGADTIVMATPTVEINTEIVKVAAPA
ncbi:hypothetical protein [Sphingomonas sp. CFBP 13720]|uniref:hypothetical protein n=1 Tax=Sphingomonas sp. CFBP 13720 TaxID=2775302 RepID=UPI00177F0A90|nr:hypothetical protein [Sphingomonas sp. CFBP 13720]MBD8677926.1 hypothetical protein [Sphingomonas sp. CFBP 13720]